MSEEPTKNVPNTPNTNLQAPVASPKPELAQDPLATPTAGSIAMKADDLARPNVGLNALATPTKGSASMRHDVGSPQKTEGRDE